MTTSKGMLLAGLATILLISHPAYGAPRQKIHQEAVDGFSVERKTGRFSFNTQAIISIGSSEASSISVRYGNLDGSEIATNGVRIASKQVQTDPITFYDTLTIEYKGVASETFHRKSGTNNPWVSQYSTGSTLVDHSWGREYTNKYNEKIRINYTTGTVVVYPDGREESATSNNFGYMIRGSDNGGSGSTITLQAINRAFDYCAPSRYICTGLTASRTAYVEFISDPSTNPRLTGEIIFTDAGGGVTKYKMAPITAYDRERVCYYYGGSTSCPEPPLHTDMYPSAVTLPGDTSPTYVIAYSTSSEPSPDKTHDDVRVSSVQMKGVTATYEQAELKQGSWGGQTLYVAYYLDIITRIGGQKVASSRAYSPLSSLNAPRRSLQNVGDGLGNITTFESNALSEVSSQYLPEGNGTRFGYDSRYNVTEVAVRAKTNSGQPELITRYAYPASCSSSTLSTCNLPISMTDPKGNVTNYTYNAQGQVLTEVAPAGASGVRPTTTYEYTWRTAYVKDGAGGYVPAGAPISMLTRKSICRTLSSCTGTSDEVATLYDYGPTSGPNNLNLVGVGIRGADSDGNIVTRWTCYKYDYFGQRIAEISPRAGLSTCS